MVDIMRVNVEKVLERDQKISELDKRAGKKSYYFTNGKVPDSQKQEG